MAQLERNPAADVKPSDALKPRRNVDANVEQATERYVARKFPLARRRVPAGADGED